MVAGGTALFLAIVAFIIRKWHLRKNNKVAFEMSHISNQDQSIQSQRKALNKNLEYGEFVD